ncbi:hypothetical protein BOTBODRAFT_42785 [Botryobasidium botryosum FD-172 SS1]|uniref:Uncharacterized protein n=1 Tax=Botryobasidium botryosum (strain FD-172 SS1) TaxID=930990 RepID=A0A067MQ30_BOTB1|nr:hypothetical protein BOTBODRAFT_42785 [Botryobasidium botryosum FD-172 SS1]
MKCARSRRQAHGTQSESRASTELACRVPLQAQRLRNADGRSTFAATSTGLKRVGGSNKLWASRFNSDTQSPTAMYGVGNGWCFGGVLERLQATELRVRRYASAGPAPPARSGSGKGPGFQTRKRVLDSTRGSGNVRRNGRGWLSISFWAEANVFSRWIGRSTRCVLRRKAPSNNWDFISAKAFLAPAKWGGLQRDPNVNADGARWDLGRRTAGPGPGRMARDQRHRGPWQFQVRNAQKRLVKKRERLGAKGRRLP